MFNLDVLFSVSNIILFMAIVTRLSGLIMSAPLLSTYPIPMQVKVWLAATIAFLLFPIVQHNTNFITPTSVPALSLILFKEFLIGYAIGFCANIMFVAIELGVNTFTIQMGLSADQALNPASGGRSPIITQVYTYLASMIFIALGAHQWLFSAIYNSFKDMPIGYVMSFSPSIVEQIVIITSQVFSLGLSIALPIFGVLFILFLHIFNDKPKARLIAYSVLILTHTLINLFSLGAVPTFKLILFMLVMLIVFMMAYFCMTKLYNGKKGKHPNFAKWFFYVFYPLHYLIIFVVKIVLDKI